MAKKEETPQRRARRNYEIRNKEEREQATKQFNTRLSRGLHDEICSFLKEHRISKVDLIYAGYEALRSQLDMNLRLDGLYDIIVEIEEKIEDAKLRKKSVEAETLTMENIYKILQRFGDLYDLITEEERKQLISHLIQEIQIYPEGESECPLKSIKFNFPVYKDGKEVREVFLKSEHNVETLVCLERK